MYLCCIVSIRINYITTSSHQGSFINGVVSAFPIHEAIDFTSFSGAFQDTAVIYAVCTLKPYFASMYSLIILQITLPSVYALRFSWRYYQAVLYPYSRQIPLLCWLHYRFFVEKYYYRLHIPLNFDFILHIESMQ